MNQIEPGMFFSRILYNLFTIALGSAFLALPTLLLWNWLLPDLFDLPFITFWQAWGINYLSGIIFRTSTQTTIVEKQKD